MAELGACLVKTGEYPAVNDNACADSCSQCDGNGILCTLACACNCLSHGCAVSVVVNIYGEVNDFPDELSHRSFVERKVARINEKSFVVIRCSGRTDTDTLDILYFETCILDGINCKLTHVVNDLFH